MADALDLLIAGGGSKGSSIDPSSWIDDFQKGRDYRFTNRNRELFANGLPKRPDNSTDWGKAMEAVLQAGGAQGVSNAVNLSGLDVLNEPSLLGPSGGQQPMAQQGSGGAGNAIASIESGGRYDALGPVTKTGDRAHGKYQVMGANVGPWTKEVLGQEMSPQAFLQNPQAQEAVFKQKFGEYTQQTGSPQKAALMWFTGRSDPGALNLKDQNGMTGARYEQKFVQNGGGGGQAPQGNLMPGLVPSQWVGRELEYGRALMNRAERLNQRKPGSGNASEETARAIFRSFEQNADELRKRESAVQRENLGRESTRQKENLERESAGIKEQNKTYGELFGSIQKDGREAGKALATYGLMEGIAADPRFYSGTKGETVTAAKRLLVSLGVSDAADAAPNEVFQKLSNKLVLDANSGSLGNGFSNADRDYIKASTANPNNTKEGNLEILRIGRVMEERKQQVAQRARDYAKKNNGQIDAGFDEELAKWSAANPRFPAPAKKDDGGGWTTVGGIRIREKR